jgi:hypothetical protein
MTVRDVLVMARDNQLSVSVEETAMSPADFKADFWSRENHCINCRVDTLMLRDLFESIEKSVAEQEDGKDPVELEPTQVFEGAPPTPLGTVGERLSCIDRSEVHNGGFVPGNSSEDGNSLPNEPIKKTVRILDVEEGEEKFRNLLVAISGSPFFEMEMASNLKLLGMCQSQVVSFHASTKQV